ncbi:MAG: glycosyltransferase family 61 protein [Pirellulales bacterium]|nr:glycosyltransferase family 61 protein [Pirellulales bacterium]
MPEAFDQPRTIRFGKYILADNAIKCLIRSQRAPARTLTISEFRHEYPESSRLVRVKEPVCVDSFCFDSWTEDEQLSVSHLPEKEIPETSVLVVPSGRIVGRKGDVDVPVEDVRLRYSKDLSEEAGWFARTIRFGKLNPRFWKRVAENSLRQRFVPLVSQCSGRVAVLNCNGSHNYFHWIAEVLPRLWTLLQSGEQADWYVADCYSRWQRASLAALGVQLDRVIQPHATFHLEADEILVPSLQATQAIPPMAQGLAKGLLGLQDANDSEPKRLIYIERAHSRRPVNADEFSAWRRKHGFDDVWLEDMSFAEQIALFQQAKVVLGVHGAGLTNIIHCRPGTLVVEFMPAGLNRPCYPVLSQLFNLRHVVINAPRVGRRHGIQVSISVLDQILEKFSEPS